MSQFYALMSDNTVKHISLKEEIVTEIKNIFINGGAIFKPEGIEEDVFDGNIISRNGENITYVHYDLPEDFARIPYNQADMSEYNINEDMPKSIFYYDDGKFYFQVFNKRNMLQRKMVLQFECGNIFAKMNNSAFIVVFSFICALTPYLFNRLVFVRGAFLIKAEILSVFDNNFISRRVFIFAICFILSVFTLIPSISPKDSISAFVASVTKSISENI